MRVLVCGGRDYGDIELVYLTLDTFCAQTPITLLINGAARGADRIENAGAGHVKAADWLFPEEEPFPEEVP